MELPPIDREREVYDALVMGLRDYMRKSHFTETVVPVSGGIDSALVLAIAADAVGPAHVRAYNLPSQYNSDTTRSIAERLSCALGVRYGVIPITSIDEDAGYAETVRLMSVNGVRRMPVVDKRGTLVGIITVDDILRQLAGPLVVLSDLATRERQYEAEVRR